MCLAEFAAKYVVKYERDDNECDALPASESETTSTLITLTDSFGKMNKRKTEAVSRFRNRALFAYRGEVRHFCTIVRVRVHFTLRVKQETALQV